MSEQYAGGFISKTPPTVTNSSAQGIWTLSQQAQYKKEGVWPFTIFYALESLGTIGNSLSGYAVIADNSNNVYVSGYDDSSYPNEQLIVKYNSLGVVQWQKGLNIFGSAAKSMKFDSSGNIYTVGTYQKINVFDVYLSKYDTAGAIQWQVSLHSGGNMGGYALAIDSSNNVYAAGGINTSYGGAYLIKYNTSGVVQWQKIFGSTSGSVGNNIRGMAVDSSGNIYTCGELYDPTYSYGIQVVKFSSSPTITWQRKLYTGYPVLSYGLCIALDSSNNVFVGGYTNNSGNKVEIVKYDTSGALQWNRRISGADMYCNAVAIDSSGNAYFCGYADISGIGIIFILKYNTSGTIQWQRTISNGRSCNCQGATIGSDGKLYLTGSTAPASGTTYLFNLVVPTDGTKTGTYTLNGYSYTYAASSFTDAASTLTDTTTSHPLNNATSTAETPTGTSSSTTFTPTITQI
jgi:hypothetical protein